MDDYDTAESPASSANKNATHSQVVSETSESRNGTQSPMKLGSPALSADMATTTDGISSTVIDIPHLSSEHLAEFKDVKSDIVERVISCDDPKSLTSKYEVEYSDTRTDKITLEELLRLENGSACLRQYMETHLPLASRKRKYGISQAVESHVSVEEDNMVTELESGSLSAVSSDERAARSPSTHNTPIRSKRLRSIARKDMNIKNLSNTSAQPQYQANGPEHDDDRDDDDEDAFSPPKFPGRGKRGRARRGRATRSSRLTQNTTDDASRANVRRSARATKTSLQMSDSEDNDGYAASPKASVPKVIAVKETFKEVDSESAFGSAHMQSCKTCGGDADEAQLVYCQGCSFTYHKSCIGTRSASEHLATKIGEDDFVLQCKYCVGSYLKKDKLAPKHSNCQTCKSEGASCAAFSEKKTPRQEEKSREENGGVDPITNVPDDKINNGKTVLRRCVDCCRAWHRDHLPVVDSETEGSSTPLLDGWSCKECINNTRKIQRLICWRPTNQNHTELLEVSLYTNSSDDDKEYLIKWADWSYASCSWMPGAWVFGTVAPQMRAAFAKRAMETNLCIFNEKDAIPKDFLQADIVLDVESVSDSSPDTSADLSKVSKLLIKFQGLGYDDVVWASPPDPNTGKIYTSFEDAYREYVNGQGFENIPASTMRERVKEFRKADFIALTEQPEGIRRGKLMGYQMEGLNWLLENYHQARSVVLADEMGLGKTVQVISLVLSLVQNSPKCWPFLIVVPNATCPNWRREFKQWAPGLRVVTYHGGRQPQDLAYKYELFPNSAKDMKAHVVIMSYDSAQDPRTATLFKSVSWTGLVVDEGQRLKNDGNLLYIALAAMKIPFRLLLTGTPLQNNKRELFNLIQFIDKSQNAETLDEEYSVLDKDTLPKLHEQIRPYFLRRTKLGVLKFLPAMAQIIVPVTMTVIQEKLSKSIMSKNPQLIKSIFADSKMKSNEKGSLNNILMQLRKCLCHPFMYSQAIEETDHDQAVLHRNLVEASSKLLLLEIMLPKLKERGHRVLIFSQFLQQLDIIEDFLFGMQYEYRRLDGQMSSLEKQQRIDEFNAPDSSVFAFLLSTRAGGVGINLATADTVIIMDPDFNPHQDMQALSRAHRIGQKNKVLCFQLVTKDSVEERIMEIGRKKLALDHALIESMDDGEIEGADLESILKHGAQALFNDDYQKSAIQYDSASVEKLLDRSQTEQDEPADEGTSDAQFCFPRVWANDKDGFDDGLELLNDEALEQSTASVWDKILAQREEDARLEAEASREELGRGNRKRQVINYRAKTFEDFQQNDTIVSDGDGFESEDLDESESDNGAEKALSSRDLDDIAHANQTGALAVSHKHKNKVQSGPPAVKGSFFDFLRQAQQTDAVANTSGYSSEDELSRGTLQPPRQPNTGAQPQRTAIKSNEWYAGSRNLGGFGVMRRRLPLANRSANYQAIHSQRLNYRANPASSVYPPSRTMARITTTSSEEIFGSILKDIKTEAQIRVAIDMLQRSMLDLAVKHNRIYALRNMLRQVGERRTGQVV